MERPSYHPQILYDLRLACAKLVNETNPPDPDDEIEHQETLRQVEAERKAKLVAAQARAVDAKSQKGEVRELKTRPQKEKVQKQQLRQDLSTGPTEKTIISEVKPDTVAVPTAHKQVPRHITAGFSSSTGKRKPADTANLPGDGAAEPLPSRVEVQVKENDQRRQADEAQALDDIRRSIHSRPKTSAAACVDYDGPTTNENSSKSTSRSTSNYDNRHRPTSTGLTSLAHTPGEEKRRSHFRRPSDESYQEDLARDKEVTLKQQQAQREAAEQYANGGRAGRPASRSSKLSRMTSRSEWSDRPSSRASNIASSIADGISNYIRPRTSTDGGRSGRSSALGLSRSESRSSSMSRRSSSGFWRRGSLRRKGSWASFRSGRGDGDEKHNKKGEPNLNRPLPALPGLDQYKETKTHIGQLMKAGARGKKRLNKKSISEPQPVVAPDTEYTATLPKPSTPILDRQVQLEEEERTFRAQLTYQYEQQKLHKHHHHHHQQHHHHHHHHDHPRRSTVPNNMESSHRSSKEKKAEKRASQTQPTSQGSKPPRRSTAPAVTTQADAHANRQSQLQQTTSGHNTDPRSGSLSKSPANTSQGFASNPLSPTLTHRSSKLHNAPPIIRGPSYKKELDAGVYPRPMDVNNGTGSQWPTNQAQHYDVRIVDVAPMSNDQRRWLNDGYDERHYAGTRELAEEKKVSGNNSLKGKMGRMFGSVGSGGSSGQVAGGEGRRRAVAAN